MTAVLGVILVGSVGVWLSDTYRTPVPPKEMPAQPSRTIVPPAADAEARRRADEAEQQRQATLKTEKERADAQRIADAKAKADAEAKRRSDEAEQQRQAALKAKEDRKQAEANAQSDPALAVKPGSGQSFRDRLAIWTVLPDVSRDVVAPAGSCTMGSPDASSLATPVKARNTMLRSSNDSPYRSTKLTSADWGRLRHRRRLALGYMPSRFWLGAGAAAEDQRQSGTTRRHMQPGPRS